MLSTKQHNLSLDGLKQEFDNMYENPWDKLQELADIAKVFLPRGPQQKEIDRMLKEWKYRGIDKEHNKVPETVAIHLLLHSLRRDSV
jgi:hypothetical protein